MNKVRKMWEGKADSKVGDLMAYCTFNEESKEYTVKVVTEDGSTKQKSWKMRGWCMPINDIMDVSDSHYSWEVGENLSLALENG